MTTLAELIPDPDAVLALEPEEIAGVALELLSSSGPNEPSRLHPLKFHEFSDYRGLPGKSKRRNRVCVNRGLAVACPGGLNRSQTRRHAWLAFHHTSREED